MILLSGDRLQKTGGCSGKALRIQGAPRPGTRSPTMLPGNSGSPHPFQPVVPGDSIQDVQTPDPNGLEVVQVYDNPSWLGQRPPTPPQQAPFFTDPRTPPRGTSDNFQPSYAQRRETVFEIDQGRITGRQQEAVFATVPSMPGTRARASLSSGAGQPREDEVRRFGGSGSYGSEQLPPFPQQQRLPQIQSPFRPGGASGIGPRPNIGQLFPGASGAYGRRSPTSLIGDPPPYVPADGGARPQFFNQGQPQMPPLPPGLQAVPGSLVGFLAQMAIQSNQVVTQLAQIVASDHLRRDTQQGYRQLKPKRDVSQITAASREVLIDEFLDFGTDIAEWGLPLASEAAFSHLRAIVKGRAKDVLEYEFALGPQVRKYQSLLQLPPNDSGRKLGLAELYEHILNKFEEAAGLTDIFRVELATRRHAEAKMKTDTCDAAYAFLDQYQRGRLQMIRAGLIPEHERLEQYRNQIPAEMGSCLDTMRWQHEATEINEVLERRVSRGCYEYIKQRPRPPRGIEELLAWVQLYAESKRRSGDSASTSNQQRGSVHALAHASDTLTPVKPTGGDVLALHHSQASTAHALGQQQSSSKEPGVVHRSGSCRECHGMHPELSRCPNQVSKDDDKFDKQSPSKCRWRHQGVTCQGRGHLARHHFQQAKSDNIAPTGNRKGKGKG